MLWFRTLCLAALFCVCFSVALVIGHIAAHDRSGASTTVVVNTPGASTGDGIRVIDIRRADFARMSLEAVLGLGPRDVIETLDDQVVTSRTDLDLTGSESSSFIDFGVRRQGKLVRMIVLLHEI